MCFKEKSDKYIDNCMIYSSQIDELNSIDELVCNKCKKGFVRNNQSKECVNVNSRIEAGEDWLNFCVNLGDDGSTCVACLDDPSIYLFNGIQYFMLSDYFNRCLCINIFTSECTSDKLFKL